jgi:hypothetical protein
MNIHQNGISYYGTGVAMLEMGDHQFSQPQSKADNRNNTAKPWADWGTNNNLPMEYLADIEATPILSTVIDTKARICIGKGIEPVKVTGKQPDGTDMLEAVDDETIADFLEFNNDFQYNYHTAKDLFALGQSITRIMLSRDRSKVIRIMRQDIAEVRFGKKNKKTGNIESIFISSNWKEESSTSAKNNEYVKEIPLLTYNYEIEAALAAKATGNKGPIEYAILNQYSLSGRRYYALPHWYPAMKWIKIAQGIPDMKAAMFKNQIQIKYLIEINSKYWTENDSSFESYTPEKRQKIKKDFKDSLNAFLTGTENAYKSIVVDQFFDSIDKKLIPLITITPIDDKYKEGQLLPDSSAADKHIMFSLMFNPALMGANLLGDGASGGAGSGSDIREAYLVQIMLLEAERQYLSKVFNIVKRFNGWDRKIQFRFPNLILTTLDTGKSTTPIDSTSPNPSKGGEQKNLTPNPSPKGEGDKKQAA